MSPPLIARDRMIGHLPVITRDQRRRAVRVLGPVLIFLALTLVLTFPLAVQAGDHLRDDGDSYEYAWAIGFGASQLTHDPLHLFQGNIFYPFPLSLAYSDSVVPDLILGAPLVALTGNPVFALNALFLLTFFLSGWGMYLLVRERTGSPGAALVAGVVYAFNPYFLDHLEQLPNVSVQWAPFALWCFERYLATGRSRWAAGFVGATVLQVLVSFYYAFILGLGIVLYVSVRLAQAPRAWLRPGWILRLLGFGLAGALAILPCVLPYFTVQRELGLERSLGEAAGFAAWPANYLASTPTLRVAFIRPLEEWLTSGSPGLNLGANERHLYPGILTVVLAIVGLVAGRRSRIVAPALCVALGFLLSLGPTIHLTETRTLATPIPSPYALLYENLPGFAALRVPTRFAGLVVFGLALLAGDGVARILQARWVRRPGTLALPVGCVILAGVEVFGGIPLVPARTGADVPPVYRWLATRPTPSPIVELPIDDDAFRESPRSYYSTFHHQPLVDGFRSFTPPGYSELASILNTFPSPVAIAAARQLDVRYVVVHGGEYEGAPDPPAPGSGAHPVAGFGTDEVYAIDGSPTFPGFDVSAIFSGCPSTPGAPSHLTLALTSHDGRPYLSFPTGTRSLTVNLDWQGQNGRAWNEAISLPLAAPILASPAKLDAEVGSPPRADTYTVSISVADPSGIRGRQTIAGVAIGSGGATGRADGKIQLVRAALPMPRPTASTGLAYELVWKGSAPLTAPIVAQVNAYDAKNAYWSYRSGREERFDEPFGCSGALLLDAAEAPLQPDIPPGRYSAEVVLIDPATGNRVPFVDPSGAVVTRVGLGSFWIRPPGVFGPGEQASAGDEVRDDLGDRIALLGWDVAGHAAPGSEIVVDARWQDLLPMNADYTVFVHVSDSSGRVIAQFDGQTTGGLYPTSAWLPGETIVDSYHLRLPPNLPAGPLHLSAGFYDLKTLARLPVTRNGQPSGSEIPLGQLE